MNKFRLFYFLFFPFLFFSCLFPCLKVMADVTDRKVCSDHPEELHKNGGVCKSYASAVQELSSPIYRAIGSCLEKSKDIENNEFLIDWNIGSPRAKAYVYANDLNYWIGFYMQGDAGGGFICLVEKEVNRVVWIDIQY